MLRPRGPLKNSGKMVTTLTLSATSLFVLGNAIDEAELLIDHDYARVEIGAYDHFRAIRHEDAAAIRHDVQNQSLRQLVKRGDLTKFLSSSAHRAHADQIVEINLVLFQRRQLAERCQQVAAAPELGTVAVTKLLEANAQPFLERRRLRDS